MRDTQQPAIAGELGDAKALRQTPGPADVGLDNVHFAPIHQVQSLPSRSQQLGSGDTRSDRLSQPRVAIKVVHPQRCLDKVQVAVLELLNCPDCGLTVHPSVADVDHEGHFSTQDLARLPNQAYQVSVRINVAIDELKLRGLVPQLSHSFHEVLNLVRCFLEAA